MGYTFPKELKIVTEQGESARFAADFLKDEIFFRSGAVIPVENAAQADREAEAGEGEILLQTDSELEEETFTLTRKGDGIKIQAVDKRGFLYGVSWVLRKMYLKDRKTGFSAYFRETGKMRQAGKTEKKSGVSRRKKRNSGLKIWIRMRDT